MIGVLSAAITAIGAGVKGFFGIKESQAKVIEAAVRTVSDINTSNADREKAVAQIITAESQSGYWLASVWRPLLMVFFAILIGCYWFGYVPENLLKPMLEGSGLSEIFDLVKIGLMGYIPGRTIEKIVSNLNVSKIISQFAGKK